MNYLLYHLYAEVNATNSIGQTALHVAALWGSTESVAFLLQHGADIDATNSHGATPLPFAASKSRVDTVRQGRLSIHSIVVLDLLRRLDLVLDLTEL